ncbi:Fe(3+) ABC transporter substrate-binding protein [Denitrobaculum tricleocarpae]|uniref:Fe(3+) ABC transporter substrate-binding protein n=1 Tax=Denitrobaculum tricleocarpae TaxID=2591009 RepID=A0A545T423_9PROT|nr:Fe(3+) ABC transporter substrate-binding protein [Denitrobaculum tricleocarpae]TQV71908.1 Fe(3+) ABC transporter substrate-binding protein [Denitrobaculum tricleocarpae]
MNKLFRRLGAGVAGVALAVTAAAAGAEELNLYSSRHYSTDEALYDNFTKATGIKINRIEGKGDALIERIKSEGANSPADVLLTVDVTRLWRADQAGLFQPTSSASLEKRVPENLRHPDGHWFGFSTRARLIYYDKAKIEAGEIKSYEDLADPKWKGKVCIRKSSNVYNQSMLASIIAAHGEAAAEDWAKGVVANFARDPVSGDTNQLRGIGSGECEIAVANSYYFVRLLTNPKDSDKGLTDKLGYVFPNQDDRGTHVNVSGAGVLANAPNRDAAVKFLEYLASDEAQGYFANGNNEYPVVAGVAPASAVAGLGDFKADPVNVAVFGDNQPVAQKIFDRAGWK